MQITAENIKKVLAKYWLAGASLLLVATIISLLLNTLLPLIIITGIFVLMLIAWEPFIGFCMMTFFIPMENLSLISPSLTFIKLIGIVTFWFWLMHLVMGNKPVKTNSFFFLLLAYCLWGLLSVTWAIEPGQSLVRILTLSQLLLMFFLGYNLVNNKRDIYFICGSYLLGTFIASCLGIYSGYLYEFTTRIDLGGMQSYNFFARLLGLGLLFNIYLLLVSKKALPRLLTIISFPVIVTAILLTGSRGTWMALFFALAVGLIFYARHILKYLKKRNVLIGLLIILVFTIIISPVIYNLVPSLVIERAESFTHLLEDMDRGSGRLDIWLVGLEIVKNNLLMGVGLSNFPFAYTEYFSQTEGVIRQVGLNRDAHNVFLTNLAELGIPGFIIFMSLLFSMWGLGRRTENPADSILCKLIIVFLVIAGLTNTDHFDKFFWLGMLIPSIMAQFGIFRLIQQEDSKVRAAFLSSIFPNQHNPTYGIFALRLVQNLKARDNIAVHVIAPVPYAPPFLWFNKKWRARGRIPWLERVDGVEIIHPRYLCLPGRRFVEWNMLFLYWAVFPHVRILKDRAMLNIIHSYGVLPAGFAGQLIAERLNLQSVCTAIGADINFIAQKSATTAARAKYVMANTGQIVSVGKDLAAEAGKLQVPGKNIMVIYEGVDHKMFNTTDISRKQAKARLGLAPGSRVILYVGRLVREKGIYELLEAFSRIAREFPETILALVGEGPEKKALVDLAAARGIQDKVKFTGNVPHKEIPRWYAASEIVVLLSYHEGVPNVVKEAMSCGRPVIATKTVGVSELVTDGETGILVQPKDTGEAAAALKKLLNNPELVREMGTSARELVQKNRLDWEQTAEKYSEVYTRLTGGTEIKSSCCGTVYER